MRLLSVVVESSSGRPSSFEIDTRGGEPETSGIGGGGERSRKLDATDMRDATELRFDAREPCVLTLKRDCARGLRDMMLSLRFVGPRIMLWRRVRSSTFFSVKGKYSARCVVISSLGGRCPKKLRSLPFLLGLFDGLSSTLGAADDSGASGICTPSPLRMLTELARL